MADPLLLVVEGLNDLHVICAILKRRGFQPEFKVIAEGSYEKLRDRLAPRLKPGTDLERLGIVVDADSDLLARWDSIKGVLSRAGYAVPKHPDPTGTVLDHEILPRTGVWVMPDNRVPGMLEDYLAFLMSAGDTLIERARQSLDRIPAEERRFTEVHRSKALIHTWLAWQKEPGKPLGQAVTSYLETDGPQVSAFLAWLTRLFA